MKKPIKPTKPRFLNPSPVVTKSIFKDLKNSTFLLLSEAEVEDLVNHHIDENNIKLDFQDCHYEWQELKNELLQTVNTLKIEEINELFQLIPAEAEGAEFGAEQWNSSDCYGDSLVLNISYKSNDEKLRQQEHNKQLEQDYLNALEQWKLDVEKYKQYQAAKKIAKAEETLRKLKENLPPQDPYDGDQ